VRGEHATDGANDRSDEQQEPELPDGRSAHGGGAVHRSEQHMSDLGPFERERSTATTRPQADGDDDCNHDGEPIGAIRSDVCDLRG
jgi:hypothetical protein